VSEQIQRTRRNVYIYAKGSKGRPAGRRVIGTAYSIVGYGPLKEIASIEGAYQGTVHKHWGSGYESHIPVMIAHAVNRIVKSIAEYQMEHSGDFPPLKIITNCPDELEYRMSKTLNTHTKRQQHLNNDKKQEGRLYKKKDAEDIWLECKLLIKEYDIQYGDTTYRYDPPLDRFATALAQRQALAAALHGEQEEGRILTDSEAMDWLAV
jgi:hypothetical protein